MKKELDLTNNLYKTSKVTQITFEGNYPTPYYLVERTHHNYGKCLDIVGSSGKDGHVELDEDNALFSYSESMGVAYSDVFWDVDIIFKKEDYLPTFEEALQFVNGTYTEAYFRANQLGLKDKLKVK